MRIKIIHPTRNREDESFSTYVKWLSKAENTDTIDYILSVDIDDPINYESFFGQADIFRNNNKTAIQAINVAASYVYLKSDEDYILVIVSDDTDCPEHWDTILRTYLFSYCVNYDFVAKVDDGLQATLITMPIMGKTYYERYGYVYHPDYKHMFCDQELTAVAIMTDKYIKLPLTFNHLHYTTGKSAYDEVNRRNDATWGQGEALFNERLKTNFDIENPVVPYDSIIWK